MTRNDHVTQTSKLSHILKVLIVQFYYNLYGAEPALLDPVLKTV